MVLGHYSGSSNLRPAFSNSTIVLDHSVRWFSIMVPDVNWIFLGMLVSPSLMCVHVQSDRTFQRVD